MRFFLKINDNILQLGYSQDKAKLRSEQNGSTTKNQTHLHPEMVLPKILVKQIG